MTQDFNKRIYWLLPVVGFKRKNPVAPEKKSTAGLVLCCAETESEAIQQTQQWIAQQNGSIVRVVEVGDYVAELPVSEIARETTQSIRSAANRVAVTCQPIFLVLLSAERPLYSKLYASAITFLREHHLPVNPLSEMETQSLRAQWRQKYLPVRIQPRKRHRCEGCSGRGYWGYDWESLECAEPVPPLDKLLMDGAEPIALWFERCDLPAFVCEARYLHTFQPDTINIDLYITPIRDLRWTIVCTHEQPLLGPYFCRGGGGESTQ